jgi:FG-GAP-like repeat
MRRSIFSFSRRVWQLYRLWLGVFLVMGTWPSLEAQAQAISESWFRFDPVVVRPDRTEPVVYKTLITGNPSSVQFTLADGRTAPLSNEGGGVWSVTLTAQQVLFGYGLDSANHNFVGFLDIFQGATRVARTNNFIGVLDENVSDIAGEIQNRGDMLRISPHAVNIWSPNRTPGVPSEAEIRFITHQFYQVFPDQYDFLNLVFALPSSANNRFHFIVKNEVDGIGRSRLDNTGLYGSNGRLQGISVFPIDFFFDMADIGPLHEIGHQWINYSTLPILQSGNPHWPVSSLARGIMGFNIPGSIVGGNFPYNLVPLPNGDYRLEQTTPLREFTDLDLYLMGLLPATEVGSHIVFANQSQPICNGCILSGPVVTVTVGDVIAAQGPRRPDVSTSQKVFRVATIIVTKERPLNDDELALFDYFAVRGESTLPLPFSSGFEKGITKPFYLATGGRGFLITQLNFKTPPLDFDGDKKRDIAIYRDGAWLILRSSDGGVTFRGWGGLPQDIPVPEDYDGDGKVDIAVYRDGTWYILRSSDGGVTTISWGGLPQDIPVPADYDGDGRADVAVYRNGTWFIIRSSDGSSTATAWGGLPQDIPVTADYDGDGKTDIAVYRDGIWFVRRSLDGAQTSVGWGGVLADIPVPADYDGDGKTDIAVYRNGTWFILRSSDGGVTTAAWGGLPQDIPVPADYDGDGKTDIAVYRDGIWFILRSSDGTQMVVGWGGLPQDDPLNPRRDQPLGHESF